MKSINDTILRSVKLILLCFCSTHWLFANGMTANLPQMEMDALFDLYTATNGPDWYPSNQAPWNFTGYHNPCVEKWQGIECSNTTDREMANVISLYTSNFNMKGTIPKSIMNLTQLTDCYLANNFLHGTIPPELFYIPTLHSLTLNNNDLNGTIDIPADHTAHNLYQLELESNLLTGRIPATIGSLPNLSYISFQYNFLTGQIPEEIGQLGAVAQGERCLLLL